MKSMATTISLDEKVRDRLRTFCGGGLSYSEALTRMMDKLEADRFFDEFEAAINDPDYPWIDYKDLKWD